MNTTFGAALALLIALPAAAAEMSAAATMKDADGNELGTVQFTQNGGAVLIRTELEGLPQGGWHGFHLHETGSCEDGFEAAGGHYNPTGVGHGVLNPEGAHAGDLPNIWVAESGEAGHHVITDAVTLGDGEATLMDDDGSAVIIHENPDSYEADAGAGGRIACGVIEAN